MRTRIASSLLLASSLFAQRNLNPIGNGGNVIRPGIPLNARSGQYTPPTIVNGVSVPPGIQGPGLAATMTPLPIAGMAGTGSLYNNARNSTRGFGGGYSRGSGGRRFGQSNTVLVPYPVYGGGGYTVVHNPPPGQYDPIFGAYNPGAMAAADFQQPSPTVIINQDFHTETISPVMRDYTNSPLPAPGPQYQQPPAPSAPQAAIQQNADSPLILIAMKDHTIYPARAYWVEGSTMNYVTVDGVVNHVTLDQIDRELSLKLNSERGLNFRLP